jgi:hypothetical protein
MPQAVNESPWFPPDDETRGETRMNADTLSLQTEGEAEGSVDGSAFVGT